MWLAHRDVGSPLYQLAARSKEMWAELLAPAVPELTQDAVEWQVRAGASGGDEVVVQPCAVPGVLSPAPHQLCRKPARTMLRSLFLMQPVGSMLIASSGEEGEALAQRREALAGAGLQDARLLTAAEARQLEPALALGGEGSALLVPSDVQVQPWGGGRRGGHGCSDGVNAAAGTVETMTLLLGQVHAKSCHA